MGFHEKDFSHELQNSEKMQLQIKEAIKAVTPDIDDCFLDCLKGLNAEQLIKIIEKNYKNPDGSWKKRGEMRPTESTGHAYTTIIQCALRILGYYTGEINAFYSSDFKSVVESFQEQNCFKDNSHVKVDGVVGPDTFRLIVEKLGGASNTVTSQEEVVDNTPVENTPDQGDNESNTGKVDAIEKPLEKSLKELVVLKSVPNDGSLFSKLFSAFKLANGQEHHVFYKFNDIFKGHDCKDPKILAYLFYQSFKGRGTMEKVFDFSFQKAKESGQLINTIKEFDTLGGNGFLYELCEEFDKKSARKYLVEIAKQDASVVKNFLLKRNQNSVTSPLRLENPDLVQEMGLEWRTLSGGWHETPVSA